MLTIPEDLASLEPEQLYSLKDDLTLYRQIHGRGNTPNAAQARWFCKTERARINAELRRRKLPGTRPDDTRTYGSGTANWQRAGA